MMNFVTIKKAIIDLLGTYQCTNFVTVGFQGQKQDQDTSKKVVVYYASGDFPKSSGTMQDYKHQITFQVIISVSCSASADMSVLNNPGDHTSEEIADALSALQTGADMADVGWDDVFDAVWNILMDPVNYDLGLQKGVVSDRWLSQARKDDPIPQGSLVTVTGSVTFSMHTVETPAGETPETAESGSMDTVIDIKDDDYQKTGVTT